MTRAECQPGVRVRCTICGAFARRGLYCYRTVRCVEHGAEAELREALAHLASHGVVHEPVPAEAAAEVPLAVPGWRP